MQTTISTIAELVAFMERLPGKPPSVVLRSRWGRRWSFRVFWSGGGFDNEEYCPWGDKAPQLAAQLAEMVAALGRPWVDVDALDADIIKQAGGER